MASIYLESGAFLLRLYSTVDIKDGGRPLTNEDGKVYRKQQSVRLVRQDDKLYRTKSSPAVLELAAAKQKEISRWEEAVQDGGIPNGNITVTQFYNQTFLPWLRSMIATGQKAPSTLTTYERYWDTYLANHFNGTKTLSNYEPYMGVQFLENLRKENGDPYGENTIAHIHSAASGIFTRAVSLRLITHNPWNDVKKGDVPAINAEEGVAYSEQTVEIMMQNLAVAAETSDRYLIDAAQIVLAIGIWAGLRPSEIVGLKWDAVDLDAGTITVRNAVVYGKERGTTKTGVARIVRYFDNLTGHLRAWKANPAAANANGWVVPNEEGKVINMNSLSSRVIGPMCERTKAAEWEGNAFYALRRGFGTLLVLNGASCEEVAQLMGNTRDVVWKYYFKDRTGKLGAGAMDRINAKRQGQGQRSLPAGRLLGGAR